MKINTIYSTEKYHRGNLIENKKLTLEGVTSREIDYSEVLEILDILENNSEDLRHKCITVYRDAIIIGDDTYNFCLSCGDYYKNDTHHYLHPDSLEKLRKIFNYENR